MILVISTDGVDLKRWTADRPAFYLQAYNSESIGEGRGGKEVLNFPSFFLPSGWSVDKRMSGAYADNDWEGGLRNNEAIPERPFVDKFAHRRSFAFSGRASPLSFFDQRFSAPRSNRAPGSGLIYCTKNLKSLRVY